jgi:hypothetical protein
MGAAASKTLVNGGSIKLVNIRSTKMMKKFSQHPDSLVRVPFANGRHCERSEAIHRAAKRKLDCLVATLLAMTAEESSSWPDVPAIHALFGAP